MRTEADIRAAIVAEARSWVGTPWHHGARVKGAGVDCAQLLIMTYAAVGLIQNYKPAPYPQDWHLHRVEPIFLNELLGHCAPVDEGKPGDIVMFKFGKQLAHGAILAQPGVVIHAWRTEGRVTLSEIGRSPLGRKLGGYYTWRGFV